MRYAKPRSYKTISRYGIYRLIVDNDNTTYTETSNQTPIKETKEDIYYQVLPEEENRLDIISNKHYSSPDFWWVIAMANDIIDPLYVRRGTILRIPKFNSLFDIDGPLYGRV